MSTTQITTEEESTKTHPAEIGVREGLEYYGKRVVMTPIGRWLVLLFLVMGSTTGGSGIVRAYPILFLPLSFGSAFLAIYAVDFARAEYRRGKEADDA